MDKVKKMLVCLDLSEMDNVMIRYASFLSEIMDAEEIHFLHAFDYKDLPDNFYEVFPELEKPVPEIIKDEIREEVDHYLNNEQVTTNIEVLEEQQASSIVKWAEKQDIDLIMIGKKITFRGKGNLALKVARLSHCSLMFVTETCKTVVDKIMVPLDFSDYSKLALQSAIHISKKLDATIICENVYSLPPQYFPYISVKQEHIDKIEKSQLKKCKQFLKKSRIPEEHLTFKMAADRDNSVADRLYKDAVQEEVDLIVIGSKGVTYASSFLLGGVAERLISNEKSLPVLIIKDKKKRAGILDDLLRLTS